MLNISKIISILGNLLSTGLIAIGFLGLKKMMKNINKSNENDLLSEQERKRYLRYSIYMVIGLTISMITSLMYIILLFYNTF